MAAVSLSFPAASLTSPGSTPGGRAGRLSTESTLISSQKWGWPAGFTSRRTACASHQPKGCVLVSMGSPSSVGCWHLDGRLRVASQNQKGCWRSTLGVFQKLPVLISVSQPQVAFGGLILHPRPIPSWLCRTLAKSSFPYQKLHVALRYLPREGVSLTYIAVAQVLSVAARSEFQLLRFPSDWPKLKSGSEVPNESHFLVTCSINSDLPER